MKNGQKTIIVDVYFFTDSIPKGKAATGLRLGLMRRHAWSSGFVQTRVNTRHGLPQRRRAFNTLAQIPMAVESVLAQTGVVIHERLGKRRPRTPRKVQHP